MNGISIKRGQIFKTLGKKTTTNIVEEDKQEVKEENIDFLAFFIKVGEQYFIYEYLEKDNYQPFNFLTIGDNKIEGNSPLSKDQLISILKNKNIVVTDDFVTKKNKINNERPSLIKYNEDASKGLSSSLKILKTFKLKTYDINNIDYNMPDPIINIDENVIKFGKMFNGSI